MARAETHILCTAALPEELVAHALSHGVQIGVLPFIRTELLITEALREAVTQHAHASTHVVFTSAHAVEALRELLPVGHVPVWTIHCVGERTRIAANTLFGGTRAGDTAPYAEELAQLLIADGSIRTVHFFCGEQRLDTLPTVLHAAGIAVEEVLVYRTIATPHRITDVPDGILFLSPSAVESFFSLNTLHTSTVAFAIGRTTSAALATHTSQRIILPTHSSRTALINAVCAHFTTASA